jgi:hypothetical protein
MVSCPLRTCLPWGKLANLIPSRLIVKPYLNLLHNPDRTFPASTVSRLIKAVAGAQIEPLERHWGTQWFQFTALGHFPLLPSDAR